MRHSDTDTEDGDEDEDDGPQTYREHKLAKNPRATDPAEAGPMDPAREMHEDAGTGSGFEDLEADEDVEKSAQERIEDALADADFIGTEPVENDDDRIDLSWSDEDFRADPTEAELLAEIRDELARMNDEDRERARKALTRDSTHGTTARDHEAADAFDRLEEQIGQLRDQKQAEALEDSLTAYVEASPEHSLEEDSLVDVLKWFRKQAEEIEDPADRERFLDALDRVPETGRTHA